MTFYTSGDTVSFDQNGFFELKPIICLDKQIKQWPLSLNETDILSQMKSKVAANGKGGVVVHNDAIAEVVFSAPGCAEGGDIYISENWVCVVYRNTRTYTVYKKPDSKMNCAFHELSPMTYIGSEASRCVGKPCDGYLPFEDGLIEVFDVDHCVNLPSFSQGVLYKGSILAGYGPTTGALSLSLLPQSKKGMVKALLLNDIYTSTLKQYDETVGICFNESIRRKVQKFVQAVKSGTKVENLAFCAKYKRPESLLLRAATNFFVLSVCTESRFNAADVICFPPSEKSVGPGVREFINEPIARNAPYVQGSADVAPILQRFESNVEEFKKKALAAGVVSTLEAVTLSSYALRAARGSGAFEIAINNALARTPKKINTVVHFCDLPISEGLPKLTPKIMDLSVAINKTSAELSEMLLSAYNEIAKAADIFERSECEVKAGAEETDVAKVPCYKFSQEKLNRICSSYMANAAVAIQQRIDNLLFSLRNSSHTFTSGIALYGYRHKCHVDYDAYWRTLPIHFNFWQKEIDAGIDLKEVSFVDPQLTFDGNHGWLNGILELRLAMPGFDYHDGDVSEGESHALLAQCINDSLNSMGLSARVFYAGPCGIHDRFFQPVGHRHSYNVHYNAIANILWRPVGAEFLVQIALNNISLGLLNVSSSAEQVAKDAEMHLKNINSTAIYSATKQMVNELQSGGLLSQVRFCGKVNTVLTSLKSMVSLANFDPNSSLILILQAYENLLTSDAVFSEDERAEIEKVVKELLEALSIGGVVRSPSGDFVRKSDENRKLPWIMNLGGMRYVTLGQDYNLLPLYVSL